MINPLIEYINDDSIYLIHCDKCGKKNTSACKTCSRKKTEPNQNKECHQCNKTKDCNKQKCECESKKSSCLTIKYSGCSNHFVVLNYFSELIHDWEKEIAKYNLGIQELENINYFTEETENGSFLNKVLFVFRKGHELITKEFLVSPKGDKGDKGDCFTWESLTEDLKRALRGLKGDDGITPELRYVRVQYGDSSLDAGGYFEKIENPNKYDLILTLPKQRTFDECLEDIRKLITLFNINFDALLAALTLKVNSIEDFDFCKLGLRLRNGNELSLTYNGFAGNPIILDLPEQDLYTLKYFYNNENIWEEYIALMKNGVVEGDTFNLEKFKPKDWWILAYPGFILMLDGELLTRLLRISAWFDGLDKTDNESTIDNKDFYIHIQTTSSYEFNNDTLSYDDSTWSSLNYTYDKNTGILTLPKNNSIATTTEVVNDVLLTRTFLYRYCSGDFITAILWSTDHLPRRLFIPIIEINNYIENNNNDNLFVDIDPRNISNDILLATINYTHTWLFDLRGYEFYDSNGNIINCIIKVQPSTFIYKVINGKKYLYGNYETVTCDNDTPAPSGSNININRFRLDSILHCGTNTKNFKLIFKYLDNNNVLKDLTENLYAAFYNYWKDHIDGQYLNKAIRLKHKTTNEYVDLVLLDYSSNGDLGAIYYSYRGSDINNISTGVTGSATGRRPGLYNDPMLLRNFLLYVKDSINTTNYLVYLNIIPNNSGTVTLTQSIENLQYGIYKTVFNDNVISQIPDTIEIADLVYSTFSVPKGTTYSNGIFFHDGLFISNSQLDGTPTISSDGKYAYVVSGNSVLILNLTYREIEAEVNGATYIVDANEVTTEVIETEEPENPQP